MRRFRPADPVWVSLRQLRITRAALKKLDPRLDIWWTNGKKVWRVVEWMEKAGKWSTCFYWPRLDAVTPMLDRLRRNDWSKYQQRSDEWMVDRVNRDMDAAVKRKQARRQERLRRAGREYMKEAEGKYMRGNVVVGPGSLVLPGDHAMARRRRLMGSDNLRDFLKGETDAGQ